METGYRTRQQNEDVRRPEPKQQQQQQQQQRCEWQRDSVYNTATPTEAGCDSRTGLVCVCVCVRVCVCVCGVVLWITGFKNLAPLDPAINSTRAFLLPKRYFKQILDIYSFLPSVTVRRDVTRCASHPELPIHGVYVFCRDHWLRYAVTSIGTVKTHMPVHQVGGMMHICQAYSVHIYTNTHKQTNNTKWWAGLIDWRTNRQTCLTCWLIDVSSVVNIPPIDNSSKIVAIQKDIRPRWPSPRKKVKVLDVTRQSEDVPVYQQVDNCCEYQIIK